MKCPTNSHPAYIPTMPKIPAKLSGDGGLWPKRANIPPIMIHRPPV